MHGDTEGEGGREVLDGFIQVLTVACQPAAIS